MYNAFFQAHTISELHRMKAANVIWLAKPIVAQNCITDLVGQTKWGGKSTFALNMCLAICRGEGFLANPTAKTGVVYCTEERAATFVTAVKRAGFKDSDNFYTVFWDETVTSIGNERKDGTIERAIVSGPDRFLLVLKRAAELAHERGAKLVVLDTFGQFAMLDNENDASEVYKYATKIQEVARHNFSILVLRHERKAGGVPGIAGRGSTVFAAIADIMATIRKGKGSSATKQYIKMQSRFMEVTPEEMTIQLTKKGYRLLYASFVELEDDVEEVDDLTKQDREVLDLITEAGLTIMALASEMGLKFETAKRKLERLVKVGHAERTGKGIRGDPLKYFRKVFEPKKSSNNRQKLPGSVDDLVEDVVQEEGD